MTVISGRSQPITWVEPAELSMLTRPFGSAFFLRSTFCWARAAGATARTSAAAFRIVFVMTAFPLEGG